MTASTNPHEQSEPVLDGATDHTPAPSAAYTGGVSMAEAENVPGEEGEPRDRGDHPDEPAGARAAATASADLSPLGDEAQTAKDMSYSPASEQETQAKQESPADPHDDEIDADAVRLLPGTGGPDDPGDIVLE